MLSTAERTLAAEVRAVEGGHQARPHPNGQHWLVQSDTVSGRNYVVGVSMVGEIVVFTCDHATYHGATQPERMFVPCRHGATVARRLEREGVLHWDGGQWFPTAKRDLYTPDDPFEGLPT